MISSAVMIVKDLDPVASLASIPNVLVINPSVNVSNVEGLIAYAKANPNALFYGGAGIGSSTTSSRRPSRSVIPVRRSRFSRRIG